MQIYREVIEGTKYVRRWGCVRGGRVAVAEVQYSETDAKGRFVVMALGNIVIYLYPV
jgi:hypothetical protein